MLFVRGTEDSRTPESQGDNALRPPCAGVAFTSGQYRWEEAGREGRKKASKQKICQLQDKIPYDYRKLNMIPEHTSNNSGGMLMDNAKKIMDFEILKSIAPDSFQPCDKSDYLAEHHQFDAE